MWGRTRDSEMNELVRGVMVDAMQRAPQFAEDEKLCARVSAEELAGLVAVTMDQNPASGCNRVAAAVALNRLVHIPSLILHEHEKRAAMIAIAARLADCTKQPTTPNNQPTTSPQC